jgi:hypothetical protein
VYSMHPTTTPQHAAILVWVPRSSSAGSDLVVRCSEQSGVIVGS